MGLRYCYKSCKIGLLKRKKSVTVILGNPIGTGQLQRSLEAFTSQHPHCLFLHINHYCQKKLLLLGFSNMLVGHEQIIYLQNFQATTKSHPRLLKNIRRAKQNAIKIQELSYLDGERLKQLQEEWLQHKKQQQFHSFINDPFSYQKITNTRCFAAYLDKEIVSLRFFTPLYSGKQALGYTANTCFYSSKAPANTQAYLLYYVLKIFKKEGFHILNLGLNPLDKHCIEQENNIFKKNLKIFTKKALRPFLNTDGIECFKRQFKAQPQPIYIAYNNFWAFLGNIWVLVWTLKPKERMPFFTRSQPFSISAP